MLSINSIPKSTYIKSLEWTSERMPYADKNVKGDSYPLTWANDDNIYTSAGDPNYGVSPSGFDTEKIIGNPHDYTIKSVSPMPDFVGWGGSGPKPTGMICVDGMVYLAIQNVCGNKVPPFGINSQHASDATILCANTVDSIWKPSYKNIGEPMFPGNKFGGPAFINFGKNNENAKDEYVYAISGDQWDNGSNLRLGRVKPEYILNPGYWEFVCAYDTNNEPVFLPILSEAIPILSIHKCIGSPDMAYVKGIDRYLLFTWKLNEDFSPDAGSNLIVMEAPNPWGPFSLVHIEHNWEGKEFNAYCPKLPLKWMDDDGKSGYLLFSGSWGKKGQEELYYRVNLRKFKLTLF